MPNKIVENYSVLAKYLSEAIRQRNPDQLEKVLNAIVKNIPKNDIPPGDRPKIDQAWDLMDELDKENGL